MLSPAELHQIVEGVTAAMQGSEPTRRDSDFVLDPQKHYDQHKRIDRLLDIFDACENQVFKIIVGAFILVGCVIAVVAHWLKP